MWLPKNERILLSYYYSEVGWAGICQRDPSELVRILYERKGQAKGQVNEEYVMTVIKSLRKHGLIKNSHKEILVDKWNLLRRIIWVAFILFFRREIKREGGALFDFASYGNLTVMRLY